MYDSSAPSPASAFLEEVGAKRIPTSSAFEQKFLRGVPRLAIEVESGSGSRVSAAGAMFEPGVSVSEMYVDKAAELVERLRTDEHRAAWAAAETACANATEEWKREHSKHAQALKRCRTEEEREAYTQLHCNLRPPHFLALVAGQKFRTGIPPLLAAHVLHPTERAADGQPLRCELRAFLALADRSEWLIEPHDTPETMQFRANEHLAATISRAIEAASKGRSK